MLLAEEDYQYRDTYFIVWHAEGLLPILFIVVIIAVGLFCWRKGIKRRKK